MDVGCLGEELGEEGERGEVRMLQGERRVRRSVGGSATAE